MNPQKSSAYAKNTKEKLSQCWDNSWTNIPGFNDHIELDKEDKENRHFKCKKCKPKKPLFIGNMLGHLTSIKHDSYFKTPQQKKELSDLVKKLEQSGLIDVKLEEKGIEQEDPLSDWKTERLKLNFALSEFIIQNRLPFSIAPKLLLFIQKVSSDFDPKVIEETKTSKNKVTKIITKCIAQTLKDKILSQLRNSPYSLSIDQTTDPFGKNFLSICATYLEREDSSQPTTKLVSVMQMEDSYKGVVIFDRIKPLFLVDKEISINLVGIVTDQGKNLAGEGEGLAGKLKANFPYAVSVNDLSHLYNLIFKASLNTFPNQIVNMVDSVSAYFNASPQRRAKLEEIQDGLHQKKLNVLHYCDTRWLSYRESLERLIKIWESLDAYFKKYITNESENFRIENQFYATVLLRLIDKLNFYNVKFQSANLHYDQIVELMEESFVVFAKLIVLNRETRFLQLYNLSFQDETLLLDNQTFGIEFIEDNNLTGLSNQVDTNLRDEVFASAKKFVTTVLTEMKQRLPLQQEVLSDLEVVFFTRFDKRKWENLARQFTNFIPESCYVSFRNELERFSVKFDKAQNDKANSHINFLEEWNRLRDSYPLLWRLARAVAVFPYASVPVERIFSQLKEFKTKKRSRLTVKNLEACLLVYQAYGETTDSIVTPEMIQRYKMIGHENQFQNLDNDNENALERSFNFMVSMKDDNIEEENMFAEIYEPKKTKATSDLVREDQKKVKKTT